MTLLECKHLSKSYGKKPALSDINLQIDGGHIIGLLGPNGSGKTTLIKLITGLLTPSAGEIYVNETPVGIESKKVISYLPDHNFLSQWMSVQQMVDYFADFYDNFRRERAEQMLRELGIQPSAKIKTLSKGTQEKVALILVMSRDADLYLLDEPIAGVDPASRDYIIRTILTNYNENSTVILSTHLISDIESILNDVIFINYGHIVRADSADNIRNAEGKSVDAVFREVFRC